MQQAIFDQSLNFTKNGTEKGKTKEFNNVDDLAQQEKAPELHPDGENNEAKFNWDNVDSVQTLTIENQELREKMTIQEREMDDLQVLLEALEPVPGLDAEAFMDVMHGSEMIDQDIRDAKIVHQAKKIKKLTVSMNKERGRTAAIQDKLERAQKEMENMETKKGDTEGSPTNGAQSAAKANRKVEEYRMKLENANEQLKQYHRALVKEIGDGFTISKVMSDTGDWRGRDEKIMMLQAKLKRAEMDRNKHATNGPVVSNVDERTKDDLKSIREHRMKQLDAATKENDALKVKNTALAQKFDAFKSRIKVLEKESSKSKNQVKVLLEKVNNDDALIAALQNELQDSRSKASQAKTISYKHSQRQNGDNSSLQVAKLENTIRTHERQLDQQEKIIQSLQSQRASVDNDQAESLRQTFRASMVEKEQAISELKATIAHLRSGTPRPQEDDDVDELREENAFLASELQKLKQRYTTLVEKQR